MRPDRRLFNLRTLLALSWLMPLTAAAVTSTDYAYRFALETKGNSEAWRIELTPEVYAASLRDAGLRDLVVVNAQGREVPFAPMPAAPPQAHAYTLNARLLPLPADSSGDTNVHVRRNANGDIVIDQSRTTSTAKPTQWLLDAHRAVSLDSIEIEPSALVQDLRIHVVVTASDDLQQWSSRSEDTEIVSIKRGEDAVEQRKISVSGEPARYYRITVTDGDAPWDSAQAPAVVLNGSYTDPLADRAATRQWQSLQAQATGKSTHGGTDYDYVLPAALPVEAVRVMLADANTVARFSLFSHDDAGAGAGDVPLASITATKMGNASDDAQAYTFNPMRMQHLRLHTDTPLPHPPAMAVAWHADVFVFLADGAGPYSLLAGSYAARRGDYPVDAALEKMRPSDASGDWQPPLAALGARSDVGGAAALLAPKVPFDWTKPVLWIVLIGGALLVAGMALSLLRQSKRDSDSGRGPG